MTQREKRLTEKKTLDYYLSLPYPILLIPDEDGFWFAEVPLLPGCMTQGASRDEALEMIEEAKTGWLIGAIEDGDEIPEPEPARAERP